MASLAAGQHAVAALDQLASLGLSARAVQHRAAAGRLHRVHQCVYSLVPPPLLTREGRWMAAVLACGPTASLSHEAAGALHGLRWYGGALIDVTVPGRAKRHHDGITLHRSTTLTPADITTVNGVPCTTVARTLLDLADSLNRRRLERAFDQAEVSGVLNLTAIHDQLTRNATRPATAMVRDLLETHYLGRTPTWSELEEAVLALARRINAPDPEVNGWIVLDDGLPAIRGDFVWREQRVVLETDGHKSHRTRQKFELERVQDQRLTIANWRPVRTTWRQVFGRPQELERTLVALLGGHR